MATITQTEKLKLEAVFTMNGGYVLDFSNNSLQRFIYNSVKLDIYDSKYEKYGNSKANRFRAFWEIESDITVGKLIEEMLSYYETQKTISGQVISPVVQKLHKECIELANKLQGKRIKNDEQIYDADGFLKKEVDEISVSLLKIDVGVTAVLEQRILEIKQCLKVGASLSVIFLCGSVLEGILLGIASQNIKEFNQSIISPRDKGTGKVKQLHEWSLNNFIDVAHNLGFIGLDVKKYSHSLRDFRNYIHPYEQMSSRFNPDIHTARISWQVLKAAINDLYGKVK